MTPACSIVIPTRNRSALLSRVLRALEGQLQAPPFEIIVVDDGSTDGTEALLDTWQGERPLRWLRQQAAGPAVARNRGIELATGEWLAFLGDDTVPEPGWLSAHQQAHRDNAGAGPLAVLGRVEWPRRPRPTRFMHYINEQGPQFGFALIQDAERVPFNFFYTANVSLSRQALADQRFHPGFPGPAWEDIELARRLMKRGVRLCYRPGARVAHHHHMRLRPFLQRMERVGAAGPLFYSLHPDLGPFLGLSETGPSPLAGTGQAWRLRLYCRLLEPLPIDLHDWWEVLIRHHYHRGLIRGWAAADGADAKRGPHGDGRSVSAIASGAHPA